MSRPQPVPQPPEDEGAATAADSAERRRQAARREHSLLSLLELSRELRVSLDLHETADLLLFNLMGQLGSARSALWMLPEERDESPVLVRSHGFQRKLVESAGALWSEVLDERFHQNPAPVLSWALSKKLDSAAFELLRRAEIALFAPLHARDELLGWIALGDRVDGSAYAPTDLQVVEAARGMVAVSLLNVRLYNRARETNRHLHAANEHLRELDRLKTEFLSNVNHELRTPLTVVMASLEFVTGNGGTDPRVKTLLESAYGNAQKLDELIRDLLTFSEVTGAKLPIHPETEDVFPLIEACAAERQPGVTAGLRELVVIPAKSMPPARFDRLRVRQILDELIDNAVKFTPRGARIQLRATPCREDGAEWVKIEVSDNGPGIPGDKTGSLFNSFEQVDGSSTRTVGGLGLGLAFAHQMAERMECRLGVETKLGEGATFWLLLPMA